MSDPLFHLTRGAGPLIISAPHTGVALPPEVAAQLTPAALLSGDTDWHLRELYAPLAAAHDATLLSAHLSRYAVDLNRPESDESLYPGQRTTGLCPRETFEGAPLYLHGGDVSAAERARRVEAYWRPYHRALRAALDAAVARHGWALLWEAHSIRSEVPLLFEGLLPDLNIGTHSGRACAPEARARVEALLARHPATQGPGARTWVMDGRFKGGYITRHYGRPAEGVHAVQLELSQRAYLRDERAPLRGARPEWDEAAAAAARALIGDLLSEALAGAGEARERRAP